jgi:flagella basal body P-ring formation protein FlgA
MRIQLPAGVEVGVVVEQMQYDAARGRFNATLSIGEDANSSDRLKVTGRVHQTAEAVVLTRPIQPGETIRLTDVQILRLRADQVGAATVTDPARMIGKTVRRPMAAGQPIRAAELAPVLFVTRNSLITVKVDSPRMTLVMQGKALDDGGEGDAVRVVNTRSDRMVQGLVTGPGEVTVRSGYQIAAK